jgi:hypothetical protein
MEDTNAPTEGWQRDAELLLSFLEGLVRNRQLVFASSPYLTSKRFYDLCLEHGVRTAGALGEREVTWLLAKNKEEANRFAQSLQTPEHPFVLNPTALVVDSATTRTRWSQREYFALWNLVIAKKCRTLYFNQGWQFSNSCVLAYLSGLQVGAKLLDHSNNPLGLDTAKKLIRGALGNLEDFGFNVTNLQAALAEIRSFGQLG